jgi:hypothetical protein
MIPSPSGEIEQLLTACTHYDLVRLCSSSAHVRTFSLCVSPDTENVASAHQERAPSWRSDGQQPTRPRRHLYLPALAVCRARAFAHHHKVESYGSVKCP